MQRLQEARQSGKADPSILTKFNKLKLEEQFDESKKVEVDPDMEKEVVASDGTLPGGMSPEELQKLMGNPELMALLQSTKMQEAMKLIMTGGGQEELEKAMADDEELRDVVTKLNKVLGSEQ